MMTIVGMARLATVLVLGSAVLAAPEIDAGPPPAGPRRFHAKFVIDRVAPSTTTTDRRTAQSIGINHPTAVPPSSTRGPDVALPNVAKIRSTTRCREGCLQKGFCWLFYIISAAKAVGKECKAQEEMCGTQYLSFLCFPGFPGRHGQIIIPEKGIYRDIGPGKME
ncbi:alcohol dehydrogenase [Anopheles sinensis]|uniref:Alcohol dehydrogenase n=1 Tax=Anopheles sinensis TaxID=74873 RepID=A0A084WFL9_ANOSI|nr:alcohol dehydrogenase [Anopheles sinensis]